MRGNDDAAVEIRFANGERGFVGETFRGDSGSVGGDGVCVGRERFGRAANASTDGGAGFRLEPKPT